MTTFRRSRTLPLVVLAALAACGGAAADAIDAPSADGGVDVTDASANPTADAASDAGADARARADVDANADASADADARAPNRAPEVGAVTGLPSETKTGIDVAFGAAYLDPDADVVTVLWDFGDGATSSASSPSHAYAESGVYTVRVTVTDPYGASASSETRVVVRGPRPVADWRAVRGYQTTIWLAGGDGVVVRSDDMGASWLRLPTGTTAKLTSLAWERGGAGVTVVGAGGVVLRSRPDGLGFDDARANLPGGVSWRAISKGFSALSATKALALLVGDNAPIWEKEDTATTWKQATSDSYSLRAVTKPRDNFDSGWSSAHAVGVGGTILQRRVDNGAWRKLDGGTVEDLLAVCQPDYSTIYAFGMNRTALMSRDQGDNWTKLNVDKVPVGTNFTACAAREFVGADEPYVTGSNGTVYTLKSSGGGTWELSPYATAVSGTGLDAIDRAEGDPARYAVGKDGIVLRPVGFPESWVLVP